MIAVAYVLLCTLAWLSGWASAAGVGGLPGAHRPLHPRRPSSLQEVAVSLRPWKCKVRRGREHCHLYRDGQRNLAEITRQERELLGPALDCGRWMFERSLCPLLVTEP